MDRKEGSCSENNSGMACRVCDNGIPLLYWCETCQRLLPDKRCPSCGLKGRKVRQPCLK